MVSRKEQLLMKLWRTLIISNGYLSRGELQTKSGNISITKYNQIKPYFEEEIEGTISYDKLSKTWFTLNPQEESVRRDLVSMGLIVSVK